MSLVFISSTFDLMLLNTDIIELKPTHPVPSLRFSPILISDINFIKVHSTSSKDENIVLDKINPIKQVIIITPSNNKEKNNIFPLHSGFLQQQQQQQLQQQKNPKQSQHTTAIIPNTRKNTPAKA